MVGRTSLQQAFGEAYLRALHRHPDMASDTESERDINVGSAEEIHQELLLTAAIVVRRKYRATVDLTRMAALESRLRQLTRSRVAGRAWSDPD